jgi:hypothetical protein
MQSPRKVHGGSVPKQTTETAQAQMVEEEEEQERERESGTAANSEEKPNNHSWKERKKTIQKVKNSG